MGRGAFITLEGPEGAGKTTQARLLGERLRAAGWPVVLTREPGGDPLSEAIRSLLQNPELVVTPRAELLLFLAARAQHVDRVIRPSLERGEIVICDRFSDSTLAYQGYGAGIPWDAVASLVQFATGGLSPDLTLLLDVDPAIGLQRQGEWTRMEHRGLEFHRRVREGFLALARMQPDRIRLVDASRTVEEVAEEIWSTVSARLHGPGAPDPDKTHTG